MDVAHEFRKMGVCIPMWVAEVMEQFSNLRPKKLDLEDGVAAFDRFSEGAKDWFKCCGFDGPNVDDAQRKDYFTALLSKELRSDFLEEVKIADDKTMSVTNMLNILEKVFEERYPLLQRYGSAINSR